MFGHNCAARVHRADNPVGRAILPVFQNPLRSIGFVPLLQPTSRCPFLVRAGRPEDVYSVVRENLLGNEGDSLAGLAGTLLNPSSSDLQGFFESGYSIVLTDPIKTSVSSAIGKLASGFLVTRG